MHESTTSRPDSASRNALGEAMGRSRARPHSLLWLAPTLAVLAPASAQAGLLEGETVDTVANVLSWVVLTVGPAVGIVVFLMINGQRAQVPRVGLRHLGQVGGGFTKLPPR